MLRTEDLTVCYSGLTALRDINVSVAEGEFIAIIGPNGAGKTTLLNTLSGLTKPLSGSVNFLGNRIDGKPAYEICNTGIAQVPEGGKIFPRMKVIQNLEMGAYIHRARQHFAESLQDVFRLFPILEQRKDQLAGTLSGGEQQMLAIGRGLMSRPKLLMLDEPTQGIAPKAIDGLLDALRSLSQGGLTIILVSQEVLRTLKLVERAYVLENSRIVMEDSSTALMNNSKIKESYLGL
jgi:branched-chain amino acid transport system ATP-binding protein